MEHSLTLGCLGLGVVGWLCAFLMAHSRPAAPLENAAKIPFFSSTTLGLALGLPVLVWLATLPTAPPFSAGQGWGRGFLLGGLAAVLSALAVFRAASSNSRALSAAATAPLFAALAAVCVPLLWMRHAVIDALLGVALGFVAVSLVLHFGSGETENRNVENAPSDGPISLLLLNGSAFAVTLCAGAALGVYRDFVVASVARGTYSAVVVALAGSVALALLGGALIGSIAADPASVPGARPVAPLAGAMRFLLITVVPLAFIALIGMKVLDDLAPIYLVAAGCALGLTLRWMLFAAASAQKEAAQTLPLAILVALGGFMFAYQLMQGFGVALMLLAAWPFSLLSPPFAKRDLEDDLSHARFEAAQATSLVLCFLAVLLMSRLFATHYRAELRGAGLSDQFALFGFVAGAAMPVCLGSWLEGSRNASWPRLVGVGALSLVMLGAMLSVWGLKIVPAFFVGLALSSAGWSFGTSNSQKPFVALFSLALGASATQWAARFAPLAEVSRAQRLQWLLWSLGALFLLILVVDYGSRLIAKMRHRSEATPAESPGAPSQGVS